MENQLSIEMASIIGVIIGLVSGSAGCIIAMILSDKFFEDCYSIKSIIFMILSQIFFTAIIGFFIFGGLSWIF